MKNGGRRWCKNVKNHNKEAIRWKERVKASERVKCEFYHCSQDAANEVFMEFAKWQGEFNAWEQYDRERVYFVFNTRLTHRSLTIKLPLFFVSK